MYWLDVSFYKAYSLVSPILNLGLSKYQKATLTLKIFLQWQMFIHSLKMNCFWISGEQQIEVKMYLWPLEGWGYGPTKSKAILNGVYTYNW